MTFDRTGDKFVAKANCAECPLAVGGRPHNYVPGQGSSHPELVLIGEAPGRQEVQAGKPFIGPSGRLLDATLNELGAKRSDMYATNVVLCRPPTDANGGDTAPPVKAIECCRPRLQAEVEELNAPLVVALGGTASQTLCNTKQGISQFQGALTWNEELHRFVLPTYHPAAVLHGNHGYFDDIWDSLQRAVKLSRGELPMPPKEGPDVPWKLIGDGYSVGPHATEPTVQDRKEAWDWLRDKLWYLDKRSTPMEVAIDTESSGTNFMTDAMLMVQFYAPEWGAWAITAPLLTDDSLWAGLEQVTARQLMAQLLVHPMVKWILHNTSYDRQVFRYNFGVTLPDTDRDTMILALGLTEKGEQVGLKYLSRKYLNAPFYEAELDPFLPNRSTPFHMVPPKVMAKYGCYDTYCTYHLNRLLPTLVKAEGTMDLCKDHLLYAARAFSDCEFRGARVDLEYAESLEAEWLPIVETAIANLQDYARSIGFPKDPKYTKNQTVAIPCPECVPTDFSPGADRKLWRMELKDTPFGDPSCKKCMKRRFVLVGDNSFNPRSFLHMQHVAFDILGMHKVEGKRSADANFFEHPLNKNHEFTKLVMALREVDHLLRTYVRGIKDDVWPDGFVHPDFLLFGTVTGRLSIRNPPLQTLPKWGASPERSKAIRKMFVPDDEDSVILDVDYKNLELFVAAALTGDEDLYAALTRYDFHAFVAANAFGKSYEWMKDPENKEQAGMLRFLSKFITFGIAYGRSAWSLASGELKEFTGGDEREAQKYVDGFWTGFPAYHRHYTQWQRDALTKGELRTPMGRVRRWRLIMPGQEGHIKNQAVNFPIQSTASDICLSALIRLNKELSHRGWGRVLFTVHDSLVFSVKKAHLREAVELIRKEMTTPPFETTVKFDVDIEVGPNLGEVTSWEKYQAKFLTPAA